MKTPIWCLKFSMYIYSANSQCENCEHFEKCYEYNKRLTENVRSGATLIVPRIKGAEG